MIINAGLLLLLATLSLAPAQAQQVRLAPWYLGVKGGAVLVGDRAADEGRLYGIELGANITPKWAVEAELFADTMKFDAGFDLDHTGFAFNLIQFNRIPLWNPYFLVGLGALRFESPGEADTSVLAQIAVGGQWQLGANGVMLRAEARYRYSPAESETPGLLKKGEGVLTLGLTLPLGR